MPPKTYRQLEEDEPLFHTGNWCGPNWTAGQVKPASEITPADYNKPATSEGDQKCKDHDIDIFEAKGDPDKIRAADERFIEATKNGGFQEQIMSKLVKNYGPAASLSNMPPKPKHTKPAGRIPVKFNNPNQKKKYKKQENLRRLRREQVLNDARNPTEPMADVPIGPAEPNYEDEHWDDDIDYVQQHMDNKDYLTPDIDEQILQDFEDEDIVNDLLETPSTKQSQDSGISPNDQTARSASFNNLRTPRQPLSERLQEIDEQEGMEDIQPLGARSMNVDSGGPQTAQRQETTVDYFNQRELGILTNTRTAILPVTVYFSINMPKQYSPIHLSIRMNHWRKMFLNTSFVTQTVATYNDTADDFWTFPRRTTGISIDKPHEQQWRQIYNHEESQTQIANVEAGATGAPSRGRAFDNHFRRLWGNYQRLMWYPNRLYDPEVSGNVLAKSGADVDVIPAWARWYEKIYEYMSVMETKYKLTIVPAGEPTAEACDMVVFKQMDCKTLNNNDDVMPTSQAATEVLQLATELPPDQLRKYKNVKKLSLDSYQNGNEGRNSLLVDSGTYIPGTQKNIQNEEDIKTWYKTGQADYSPQWEETMNYYFYQKEFSSRYTTCFHAKLEMAYVVQYKELKPKIKYHHPWAPAHQTPLILGVDDQQKPTPLYVNIGSREYEVNANTTNGAVNVTSLISPIT